MAKSCAILNINPGVFDDVEHRMFSEDQWLSVVRGARAPDMTKTRTAIRGYRTRSGGKANPRTITESGDPASETSRAPPGSDED